MIVYLIRHGATDATEKRLYCGSTDIPLSDAGKIALRKNRAAVSAPENARFITSGTKRCTETLKILFGDVPVEVNEDLREMDFGKFEMKSYSQLKSDPEYQAWITGDNEKNRTPDGESGSDMKARALSAFLNIVKDGQNAVIVTHGGVIAAIMEYLFPEENKNRYEWQCKPGEWYKLTVEQKNVSFSV